MKLTTLFLTVLITVIKSAFCQSGSTSPWITNHDKNFVPTAATGRSTSAKSDNVVKTISTLTRLGKIDIRGLENATNGLIHSDDPPDNLYHVALISNGFAFEFIFDKGIEVTEEVKWMNLSAPIWNDGEFKTAKSAKEIKEWIQKETLIFNQGTYHVVTKNCLDFVKTLIEFLGGKEPAKYSKQRNWLKKNSLIGNFMQSLLVFYYSPEHNRNGTTSNNTTSHKN